MYTCLGDEVASACILLVPATDNDTAASLSALKLPTEKWGKLDEVKVRRGACTVFRAALLLPALSPSSPVQTLRPACCASRAATSTLHGHSSCSRADVALPAWIGPSAPAGCVP